MRPEQAWATALGQLQTDMPKAAFDTWVRNAEFVSYKDGTFIIGLHNEYARDWLESRLTSSISRMLVGSMNRSVEVNFVVLDYANDDETNFEDDPGDVQLKVRVAYKALRDSITEPHKVVVVPGYFRRWVPFLGPTLAWIVVAFRQVMFLGTRHKAKPNAAFRTSPQQVARWAGIARNTLWRNMKDHRLRWFLRQPKPEKHVYEFAATMPLTPGDTEQLLDFLVDAGARSDPIAAIEAALSTPISQIWSTPPLPPKDKHLEMEPMPRSVQDVVFDACGTIKASMFKQVSKLADQLAAHLMPPNNVIIVSHYFLLNWVKHLGAAPSWLITLLRDQCFISKDEIRNTVWIHGGDQEIAQMLGLCRPKTISEWLKPLEDSRFERPLRPMTASQNQKDRDMRAQRREAKRSKVKRFVTRTDYFGQSDCTAWKFNLNLVEPLIPQDQERYDRAMALIETFLETGNLPLLRDILTNGGADGTNEDAIGTSGGAFGTLRPQAKARLKQVEARLEHKEGAFGTSNGADGTGWGRVWNALRSLSTLNTPMINLINHLNDSSKDLNTSTNTIYKVVDNTTEANFQNMVLVEKLPRIWSLKKLLSTSQFHPSTRKKLQEFDLDPQILVSHMLYAHCRDAGNVVSPLAIVGSALLKDPQNGAGGHYDVLSRLPPHELASLIKQAYDFSVQYPHDYYHRWQSGSQAWDICMAKTDADQLLSLAVRLGVVKV